MENSNKEKSSKKGLIIAIVVILAIIAGVAIYFLRPTSPKDVFISKINTVIDNGSQIYQVKEETSNSTITLSGNIETEKAELKEIAQYINQGKIMLNIQADKKSKKFSVSADIDYQNESLLSGKIYYQNDENAYLYVQDLFDKYFKLNLKNTLGKEENSNQVKDFLEGRTSEKIDVAKASKILKNVISENLKEEYFSKENVDGMTKNTMKLTVAELKQFVKNVITSLKDNQEFLNCFEKSEETKNRLEESLEQINNMESDNDSFIIELSIFTKGITKDLEKIEVKASNGEEVIVKVTIRSEKVNNDTQKFILVTDESKDLGKITLNIEVKNTKNTDLDSINVSDSVDINKMSTQDAIKLYTNLTKMKLYPLIAPFFNTGF